MIISKTPLRCSFFGGGTDFKAYYSNSKYGYGSVISATISLYVYVIVKKNFDDTIQIRHYSTERVAAADKVENDILREALRMTGIDGGVDITCITDLPMVRNGGYGLATSSALAVGALNAFYAYQGKSISAYELAVQACNIEIGILGQNIGIQDQFATAIGGFSRYRFYKDGHVQVDPIALNSDSISALNDKLMLFFIGGARDSGKILLEQSRSVPQKSSVLDTFIEIVNEMYYNTNSENGFDQWGYELNHVWNLKKTLANGISNPQIDEMYQLAIHSGAYGGKVLGAGGGGFLLLYVPQIAQKSVCQALSDYRQISFHFEQQGSHIVLCD